MITIGCLVPPINKKPRPPSSLPIGQSILSAKFGLTQTVFGSIITTRSDTVYMTGYQVSISSDSWTKCQVPIQALHDRYPSQQRASTFKKALSASSNIPLGNPYDITMLCRDKITCQRLLEHTDIPMPELCTTHSQYADAISQWGAAFLKPQFGALGENVSFMTDIPDQYIPKNCEGVVPGQLEPTILQKAIKAPNGWAGLSVRHLVQRGEDGSWLSRPPVLRRSANDPVVNVARGAEALLAESHLPLQCMTLIHQYSIQAAQILTATPNGKHSVEFGLDYVIDPEFRPWLIEINSRPRGRLEALAAIDPNRYAALHQEACIQPILYLASICQSTDS